MNQLMALPELDPEFKIKNVRCNGYELRQHCSVGIRLKIEQACLRARIVFSSDSVARASAEESLPFRSMDMSLLYRFAIPVIRLTEKDYDPRKALCVYLETIFSQTGTLFIAPPFPAQVCTLMSFDHPIYNGSVDLPVSTFTRYFEQASAQASLFL